MAFYDTVQLVAGDDRPEINFTIRDSNTAATGVNLDPCDETTWAPLDITGTTIKMKFRALGSTTLLDTITCLKVAPYSDGACIMWWNPTTLDVAAGTYEGELEITYSDGTVLTVFDKLKFKVRGEF